VSEDAERDFAAFLAALPVYQRKALNEPDSAFTSDEINQQMQWLLTDQFEELNREHMRLVQCVPARLKEYRKRVSRAHGVSAPDALGIPKGNVGRPRNDAEVALTMQLRADGLSWEQTAIEFHRRTGEKTTGENLRSLLKSRKRASPRKKSEI
jgi:hypothetical protein